MGYRDDFYTQANIIGYTGDLNHDPTVYFMTGPAHGPNDYGHITQAHNLFANVGREGVGHAALYEMRAGTGGVLQEWADGQMIHESRNVFVPANDAVTIATLAQAIGRFEEQKRISDFALDVYFALADKADKERGRRFSF